ncbi:MAG TPA: UDP-N-acetylmuramate dehydrogenase [Myxococcaceae bacterium]|nr:UDP-N-acetylmuramate dehydrogenase [Myxococcaceae bacterium]
MAGLPHKSLMERLGRYVDGEVKPQEPLAPKISVRAGGAAELFVKPRTAQGLVSVLAMAREEGVPIHVLGGGANTLVGDYGVPGIVLKLPSDLFPEGVELDERGGAVTLGSGASISRLITVMKANKLVGAEFLAGIPGTLGGAVTMNAGTKMGECMTVVEALELATPEGLGWIPRPDFSYRHTRLPEGAVVTRARFRLRHGDLQSSQAQMDADLGYRKRTQPLSLPNFGSVFQNPPGDFAGRLIEQAGLKGHTIGQAQISTLHANWIVNLGGATARDIMGLITLAQERVRDQTGLLLQPEVKRVGRFEP